jgi:Rrf2 family protein
MRLSAKTEYASIAVLELAASYGSGEPIQVRRISERHRIPQRFLVQILVHLKGAGLVVSTRGAAGGYELSRDPHQITLWDVIRVIEGEEDATTYSSPVESPATMVLRRAWQAARDAEMAILQSTNFGDLVEEARTHSGMYYI